MVGEEAARLGMERNTVERRAGVVVAVSTEGKGTQVLAVAGEEYGRHQEGVALLLAARWASVRSLK